MSCDLSDDFGYWLSGLIDGEGSFQITPNRPGFICRFTVALRNDDSRIIEEIQRRTGIGRVILNRKPTGARKPTSHWRVQSRAECQELVRLLERYPLRSKKRRDFEIWRRAVGLMEGMTGSVAIGRPRDWSAVAVLKQELADVRRHPDDLLVAPVARDGGPGSST